MTLLLLAAAVASADPTARECARKGFSTGELMCSTCGQLGDRLKAAGQETVQAGAALMEDCRSCCQQEVEETTKPLFQSARIVVCG